MTMSERYLFAKLLVGDPADTPAPRVVTFGPDEEDWAVVESDGTVAFVGPALFAARFAARAGR